MAKKVTVSLTNAANNVLYVGGLGTAHSIRLTLTAVDINPSAGYYYKYYVYVNGKEFGFTDYISIDDTVKNIDILGTTAIANMHNANYFASNSTSSDAYCEVITYKGTGSSASEVSREKVTFIAKLHEDVKPTVGDIHFNPQDIPLTDYPNTLLNDYNRFGIYIGYNSSSTTGVLWQPTPGSSIVSYTISGSGIETKIVSTSNGSYKYSVDRVRVTGPVSDNQSLSYTVTIRDSRGRTNSKTVSYSNFYPYTFPRINVMEIFRSNSKSEKDENNGSYVFARFSVQYSTIGNKNFCTYEITKDDTLLTRNNNVTSNAWVEHKLSLEDTKAHQIAIRATDGLGHSTTYLYNLAGIERIINIKSDGLGIAFGQKAEAEKQVQSAWTIVGPINNTSDKKVKTNISDIDVDVINTLKPVQYNFTHISDEQTHYGFIAQDVVESLESEGVDVDKIGLIGHTVHHGEPLYTLAYTEFIPLVVKKCQELQKENNEMRAEIAEIKSMLLAHNSE